jgi:UDP-glucose 4-epimerase
VKAVLLGGSGFIGAHLAAALTAAGHDVWNCDARPPIRPGDFAGHVSADLFRSGAADLSGVLSGTPAVYHLAWRYPPAESNGQMAPDVEQNVLGTLRLLDACVRAGVGRVVFFSSGGGVYGPARSLPVSETHPTEPLSAHAISKLAVEKYLGLFAHIHGLDYVILRPGNPFGPYQDPNSGQGVVAAFLARTAMGQPLEVWGDGSATRDFFHVSDLARAALLAGETEHSRTIYNIGSGEGRTVRDVIAAIEKMLGRALEVHWRASRPSDVPVNVLDAAKARRLLGWTPHVSFEDGLRRTWEWFRETT